MSTVQRRRLHILRHARQPETLIQILKRLGLTTNLQVCLDAGDANSYDPAVQTARWLDTSGNGYDFFRGTTSGADATDPTFNGTAGGKSINEYFSFDGGDYLVYDTTKEAWMDTLHKDNAKVTVLLAIRPQLTGTGWGIVGTQTSSGSIGFAVSVATNNKPFISAANGTVLSSVTYDGANWTSGNWHLVFVSLDEGASSVLWNVDGKTEVDTLTYNSPSTNTSAANMGIGARGATGQIPTLNGVRLGAIAIWDRNLSAAEGAAVVAAVRGRFRA